MLTLNDPALLRQQCHLNAAWCGADDGASMSVTHPASGEQPGSVLWMGANRIAPFSAVKLSGLGRAGATYGIEDYLVITYICIGGI